jgi:adenosylcobinamide-GDP ribazoletransferase
VDAQQLAWSAACYPAVGAVLGLVWWALGRFAMAALPPLTVGLLLVALQWLLTGGLHLDGLSDWADGWYGSRVRARRLEIMKDSRIGALGATALVLTVLLKASLLAEAPPYWWTLVLYEALAKLVMVAAIVGFPHARTSGTGSLLGQTGIRQALVAALLPLLLLAGAPWQATVAAAAASLVALLLAGHWSSALGGLTGDCYGALHEIYQVCWLLLLEVLI